MIDADISWRNLCETSNERESKCTGKKLKVVCLACKLFSNVYIQLDLKNYLKGIYGSIQGFEKA
jgi:hypothetical protein